MTCSIFVDQIHYWGDIIVDGLFGAEHGSRWMPAGSAVATGMRISLHNDPPVTPEEPLRNISVAVTRTAPSGRVLGPEQRLTVEQAIRAQTLDAAWQLFSDDVIGSLEVGKYADLVVLSADPRAVPPEDHRRSRRARDVPGGAAGVRRMTPAPSGPRHAVPDPSGDDPHAALLVGADPGVRWWCSRRWPPSTSAGILNPTTNLRHFPVAVVNSDAGPSGKQVVDG